MNRKQIFLRVQAALWTLVAALAAARVIAVYRNGIAQAGGEPVFTRAKLAGAMVLPGLLLIPALAMTVAGWALGIRDDARPAARIIPPMGTPSSRRVALARGLCVALALGLILLGVSGGGMRSVLRKAIFICTECVGLG